MDLLVLTTAQVCMCPLHLLP